MNNVSLHRTLSPSWKRRGGTALGVLAAAEKLDGLSIRYGQVAALGQLEEPAVGSVCGDGKISNGTVTRLLIGRFMLVFRSRHGGCN